jgi:cobaltochelatase CobS
MLPSVSSVYQAVLEGKALVIKEAPANMRVIKPHPNFRFVATGNTNGSGDETGMYQGTNIGNSANYDRFTMVINKQYMKASAESQILQNHVGLVKEDADKMVQYAGLVREAYDGAKISDVISPRTLIAAARIGVKRGSFRQGITLSFINKLSKIDREVCDGLAQRIFG